MTNALAIRYLRDAAQAFRLGNLALAETECRKSIKADKTFFDAWHLLGVIESRKKNPSEALQHFDRALRLRPRDADLLNNRGSAFAELGLKDRAIKSYESAIAIRPNFAAAHNNLGCVLINLGRFKEALASYGKAVAEESENAEFINNLGIALTKLRYYDDALYCFEDAVEISPKFRDALINRAVTLNELKCYDEAILYFSRAIALEPDDTETIRKRASAYTAGDQFEEALQDYQRAYSLRPDEHLSLIGKACVMAKLGRLSEALDEFELARHLGADPLSVAIARASILNEHDHLDEALLDANSAIEINSKSPDAHVARGLILTNMERFEEAIVDYRKALALHFDFAIAQWNLGYLALLHGNFIEGWEGYEGRRRQTGVRWARLNGPEWSGEPIAGKRVLLYTEQAFGDVIHFTRYVTLLSEMGAQVIFGVYPPLAALLSRTHGTPEIALHGAQSPPYHYHLPLMSVPHVLRHTEKDIPSKAYLSAEPDRIEKWRRAIGTEGVKIGIAWQGSKSIPGRAVPLAAFAPLAGIPGVRLISLQKSDGLDQLQNLPAGMNIELLGDDFDAGSDAFLDTAAVMMNLDLIISCDTAIAHLAGALGCPVWILLKAVPDWRWMLERADSPWYPSARLFRRTKTDSWETTLTDVARELDRFLEMQREQSLSSAT